MAKPNLVPPDGMSDSTEANATTSVDMKTVALKRPKAVCPKNPSHKGTRIYSTHGRIRYCQCNTCGEQWKMAADAPSPICDYFDDMCERLSESLKTQTIIQGTPSVVLSAKSIRALVENLKTLSSRVAEEIE